MAAFRFYFSMRRGRRALPSSWRLFARRRTRRSTIAQHATSGITVHWLSLGELSRLIEVFHKEGVSATVMAGQVKHKQIFSSIRPDWRLAKLLLSLRSRNTDMLLGAVAKVLAMRGLS